MTEVPSKGIKCPFCSQRFVGRVVWRQHKLDCTKRCQEGPQENPSKTFKIRNETVKIIDESLKVGADHLLSILLNKNDLHEVHDESLYKEPPNDLPVINTIRSATFAIPREKLDVDGILSESNDITAMICAPKNMRAIFGHDGPFGAYPCQDSKGEKYVIVYDFRTEKYTKISRDGSYVRMESSKPKTDETKVKMREIVNVVGKAVGIGEANLL